VGWASSVLIRSLKKRDHLEDIRVDEKVILQWVLGK
jgi:hypothetical protein